MSTLLSAFNPLRALKWGAYIVVCCLAWLLLNRDTLREYFEARERKEDYIRDVNRLETEHQQLLAERAALQTEGFPKEKALRERMIMVKPGEEILFVDPPEGSSADPRRRTPAATRDAESSESSERSEALEEPEEPEAR